jgi:hypothetical protein
MEKCGTGGVELLQKESKVNSIMLHDGSKMPLRSFISADESIASCMNEIFNALDTEGSKTNEACYGECGGADGLAHRLQLETYISLAKLPFVQTICETGFYTGKSAAMWLCSNPTATLYSFDLLFPRENLGVIQRKFGSRFRPIEGSSEDTLAHFARQENAPFCDLMIADGGHHDQVPMSDLTSFAYLAAREPSRDHVFIMDEIFSDYENNWSRPCCQDMTKAFQNAVSTAMINKETSHCKSYTGKTFSVDEEMHHPGGWCEMKFSIEFLLRLMSR